MLLSDHSVWFFPIVVAFWSLAAEAVDFKRFDGVHRVAKQAQITQHAVLHERRDDVCGTSMKLCPSSLGGDCCPHNYACATNSCYATTKSPSTCGTKIGYHACAQVYGGGCCPDGLICQTADRCVPPSGSPYTYGCPSSQYLCPSSLGYGCCSDGMGCGINRCYSTQPTTITVAMIITASESDMITTFTTTATTVESPSIPTVFITANAGDDGGDQAIFKFYPTSIPKHEPSSNHTDDDDNHNGGLSTAQLGGIIGGTVAFLIVVIAIACIFIRRLNKLAASVETPKKSRSWKPISQKKQATVTKTEVDDMSVGRQKKSPRPSQCCRNTTPDTQHSHRQGSVYDAIVDGTFNGHPRTSGDDRTNTDLDAHASCNCDAARSGQWQSAVSSANCTSSDFWRPLGTSADVSGDNVTVAELESQPYVSELPGPSPAVASHTERQILLNIGPGMTTRPPLAHQWRRSVESLRRTGSIVPGGLDVVDEEWHGFHGPKDYMAGRTAADTTMEESLGTGDKQGSDADSGAGLLQL